MDILEEVFPPDPANQEIAELYVSRSKLHVPEGQKVIPVDFNSDVLRERSIVERALERQADTGELWDPLTQFSLVIVEHDGEQMYVTPDSPYFACPVSAFPNASQQG